MAIYLALGASGLSPARGDDGSISGGDFFEKRIRPLLADRCYKCHSAQSEKLKGGLWLDTKEGMLKGGESGKPAVVPGDAEKSLLIEAVRYLNEDLKMPPAKEGKLTDSQIDDLVTWVKMGAPYPASSAAGVPVVVDKPAYNYDEARRWWSFQPVGSAPVPRVKNITWVKSPVDRFILAKLEEKGLPPAPPADKRTLIRRATFDLTGLPPAPQDIEAFVADGSPEAFATVVDRLLASPQYGERWARHWLDVVRYTDSFDARG
ncbi:MAG TPA: DUF1549 domain-containing protein, partial [Candidatus Angelobacter sp.]|nr:DUF1549 domain-containing protein [Candidatus Angelobacter sp.]